MQGEELFALVFVLGIFAGVLVIVMAMRQRSSQLEMQHRERMAMIERGLTPGSERRLVTGDTGTVLRDRPAVASRSISGGIVLIGGGLGFMSIVGVAGGAPEAGVGIGAAVCIVGIAFIVNGLISARPVHQPTTYEPPQVPRPPVDPAL